jgi:hypothetical protein
MNTDEHTDEDEVKSDFFICADLYPIRGSILLSFSTRHDCSPAGAG